jgi:hypothetical protein
MEIVLKKGELLSVAGGLALRLNCLSGLLWVTMATDSRDYFLATGQGRPFAGGPLTLEAWADSTITIRELAAGSGFQPALRVIASGAR